MAGQIDCLEFSLRIQSCVGAIPGDFDPFADPLVVYDDPYPCAASIPSDARLAELLKQMNDHHPGATAFSITVRCTPSSYENPKKLGPVGRRLQYPASTDVNSGSAVESLSAGEKRPQLLSLPNDSCLAILTVNGQHSQSICCLALREEERGIFADFASRVQDTW
jgi:hypothetical protein